MRRRTADAARGKWRGILLALGVDQQHLTGKHGPCPMCEGRDRFRWDNKDGGGSWICNACGAGNGFDLLMKLKGWDFATAARSVDELVGNVTAEPPKQQVDHKQIQRMLNELWAAAVPLMPGDMAANYLASRGALPGKIPACLRFHAACPAPHGQGTFPALLALVSGPDGSPVNIHRTFLGPSGKANIETPRAMMPGPIPDGSAIRLYPVHGERLGAAEGIETAIRAAKRFNRPVWATISATMLSKWQPPEGVQAVDIFGDNDPKFGGQAAAFALAHRLAARNKLAVEVHVPTIVGKDWADDDAA